VNGIPIGYVKEITNSSVFNGINVVYISYRLSGPSQSTQYFIDIDNIFDVGDDVYIRKYISKVKKTDKKENKSINKFIE